MPNPESAKITGSTSGQNLGGGTTASSPFQELGDMPSFAEHIVEGLDRNKPFSDAGQDAEGTREESTGFEGTEDMIAESVGSGGENGNSGEVVPRSVYAERGKKANSAAEGLDLTPPYGPDPTPDDPDGPDLTPKDFDNFRRIDQDILDDIADDIGTDQVNVTPTDEVSQDDLTEQPSGDNYQGTEADIVQNEPSQEAEPVQDQIREANDYGQESGDILKDLGIN